MIVEYTNLRLYLGEETSVIEIRGLIGLLLLFGVTKKNDVDVNEIWKLILCTIKITCQPRCQETDLKN